MTSTIRFKFRAELSYSNLPFDGHYITVGELKRLIAEKKGLGVDAANELLLTDATSKRDYENDSEQVMKNSAVIVKRVAAAARPKTIIGGAAASAPTPVSAQAPAAPVAAGNLVTDLGVPAHVDDEFGEDPLAAADEQAWLSQVAKGVGLEGQLAMQTAMASGRGGRGRGRGFGPGAGRGGRGMMSRECLRCGQLGHFVNECPTQGDPAYDRRVKVPSGIPSSKIQRNADGSLYLPDGQFGELAANTRAFNKLAALMNRGPQAVEPVSAPAGTSAEDASAAGPGPSTAPTWQQPGQAARNLQQQQQQLQLAQLQQVQQQQLLQQQQEQQGQAEPSAREPTPVAGEGPGLPNGDAAASSGQDVFPALMPGDAPALPAPVLAAQAAPVTATQPIQPKAASATPEPQLFDDDFDHSFKQPAQQQPVKLGLGMLVDEPARRSVSPAPSRLTGSRALGTLEGGTAAAAAAAAAAGRAGAGRDGGADVGAGDGVPASLRGVGCSERELLQALPFLRDLLPGDMAMTDIFKAFGNGRPLTRREFLDMQSAAIRHAAGRKRDRDRGRERDKGDAAGTRRDEDRAGHRHGDRSHHSRHPSTPGDRDRGRRSRSRSRSRGRRAKRSRSGSGGRSSRSRSRSPLSPTKRRRGRGDHDAREREQRGRDRDREKDRERGRDAGRLRDRDREREPRRDAAEGSPSVHLQGQEARRKRSRSPPAVKAGADSRSGRPKEPARQAREAPTSKAADVPDRKRAAESVPKREAPSAKPASHEAAAAGAGAAAAGDGGATESPPEKHQAAGGVADSAITPGKDEPPSAASTDSEQPKGASLENVPEEASRAVQDEDDGAEGARKAADGGEAEIGSEAPSGRRQASERAAAPAVEGGRSRSASPDRYSSRGTLVVTACSQRSPCVCVFVLLKVAYPSARHARPSHVCRAIHSVHPHLLTPIPLCSFARCHDILERLCRASCRIPNQQLAACRLTASSMGFHGVDALPSWHGVGPPLGAYCCVDCLRTHRHAVQSSGGKLVTDATWRYGVARRFSRFLAALWRRRLEDEAPAAAHHV